MHGWCNEKPTVTLPDTEHHRPVRGWGTKQYCLVTDAQWFEQLARSCYAAMPQPGVKSETT